MNPLQFLKDKLQGGLSDVGNWIQGGENDVTNAVHSLFGTNSTPQNTPPPQFRATPPSNTGQLPAALQIQNSTPNPTQSQQLPQPVQMQQPQGVPANPSAPKVPQTVKVAPTVPVAPPSVRPVKIAQPNAPKFHGQIWNNQGVPIKPPKGNASVDENVANFVRGSIEYVPKAFIGGDIIDPIREAAAQITNNPTALKNAQKAEKQDNFFSPVVPAANDLSTAIVAPTVEKNAEKSAQNTTTTLLNSPYGTTPAGRSFAQMMGSANKEDMMNWLLSTNGITPTMSTKDVALKVGGDTLQALAPLSVVDLAGMLMGHDFTGANNATVPAEGPVRPSGGAESAGASLVSPAEDYQAPLDVGTMTQTAPLEPSSSGLPSTSGQLSTLLDHPLETVGQSPQLPTAETTENLSSPNNTTESVPVNTNDSFPQRNLEAETAAHEIYRQTGSFDKAVQGYQNVSGADRLTAASEVRNSLHEARLLDTTGEGEPHPLGATKLPVDRERSVAHEPKTEGSLIKATSLENRALHLGPEGREFVQRATNVRNETRTLEATMRREAGAYYDLSPTDQRTAWLVKEGKAISDDPKIRAAVEQLNELMPKIRQEGISAGIDVGDQGTLYMPHQYPSGFFDSKQNFLAAVRELVDSGKAPDEATAVQMLNKYRNGIYRGGHRFGNLELPRETDISGYDIGEKALNKYFHRSAQRIAEAHQFGADNEVINRLIVKAARNGNDAQALQDIFDHYWNPSRSGRGAVQIAGTGVRRAQYVLQLQKAFISHLPQGFANAGSEIGFTRFAKAVADRTFSTEDNAWLDRAGFRVEDNAYRDEGALSKFTAPLLDKVRQYNRDIAGIGGRDYADALAAKGDEAGLREWGVTGKLERNGRGYELSESQRIQAAHALADRTIFTSDPLQSPAWTQKELGKWIGQYRTAYTFKQARFINQLFKQAASGNVAPLARYLGIAVPVSGAVVHVGKNLFTSGRPIKKNEDLKTFALDSLTGSGALSALGGIPESVLNNLRYDYNGDQTWQNLTSAVAPGAGTVVETGQNADNALRGNSQPLVKQGLTYVPGGTAIANRIYPTKVVSPAQQQYLTAYQSGMNKLNQELNPPFTKSADPNAVKEAQGTRNLVTAYLTNDHTPDGKTIIDNQYQQAQKDGALASDPTAMKAVQNFEKSLPNHNPMWDLPPDKLAVYLSYKNMIPGDPNTTVAEQKNPWLTDQFAKEVAWGSKLQLSGNAVEGPNYVPYPALTSDQQNLLTQAQQLGAMQNRTADQEKQLQDLESNPDLQQAFALLNKYTNDRRALWPGVQPIPHPSQNLSPEQEQMLQQESALPKGSRGAFIRANQDAWNQIQQVLATNTIYNVERYGGIIQQGGSEPNFLKDVYNAGKYDIAPVQQADGSTSYQINPEQAYALSKSASGSTFKPFVQLPSRPKKHATKIERLKTRKVRTVHIKKTAAIHVKKTRVLKPTHIGHGGPLRIRK